MRRKLIVVLVIGLAVAVPASPAVVGWHTDRMYHDLAAELDSDTDNVGVEIDDYEVGWLESRSRYTIEITGPWADLLREQAGGDGAVRIEGRDQIRHGPWTGAGFGAARIESQWRAPELLRALGQDDIAEETVARARSTIDARGNLDTRFAVRDHAFEFSVDTEDGGEPETVEVDWRDAAGRAGVEPDLRRLLVTLATLRVEGSGGDSVSLERLEMGSRTRPASDGLQLGSGHLAVDALDARFAAAEDSFELGARALSLENAIEADDDTARADSIAAFDELRVQGLALDDGEIHLRASELDREPLARLQSLLDEARATVQDGAGEGSEVDELDADIRDAFGEVLRGSPSVRSERIHIGTPDGAIRGDLTAGFDGERPFDAATPVSLIDPIHADFELRIPHGFARRLAYASMEGELPQDDLSEAASSDQRQQIDQALEIIVGLGLIEREGDELILQFDKEAGGPPLINNQDIMAMIEAFSRLTE